MGMPRMNFAGLVLRSRVEVESVLQDEGPAMVAEGREIADDLRTKVRPHAGSEEDLRNNLQQVHGPLCCLR